MEQPHHMRHGSKASKNHEGIPARRVFKLLLGYLVISLAVAGWINYSSYEVFNPLWTVLSAVVAAVLITAAHLYHGRRKR